MENEYLSLREIQLAELHILKQFISFCNKHSLRYSLYGGTLLGAVRHKGFIPWDDDIDVMMTRPEYEKLIELIKNGSSIGKNLIVSSPELQESPDFLFMKIYDKNIKVDAVNGIDSNYLWIDVFPFDGIKNPPEKELKKILRLRRIFLSKRLQETKRYRKDTKKSRKIIGTVKRLPLKLISYPKLVKYFVSKCKKVKYGTTEYVCDTVWARHPGNILKKEWLNETVKVSFEDIKANAFGGYKEYLESRYGNYLELPPEKERITHEMKAYRIDKKNKL
ncbi:LicD family protein [Candidatus Saccharibacteria bacterium]|nr:LicD family protein [Candidatus Saccharibacteria bacterium]